MAWGAKSPASDVAALVAMARKDTTKNLVVLPNRRLDDAGAVTLAEEVAKAPALENFSLTSQTLGPDGVAALAVAALTNPTVTRLALGVPMLDDAGITLLGRAIAAVPEGAGVEVLELQIFGATPRGIRAFSEALSSASGRDTPVVGSLAMLRMPMGAEGLAAVAAAAAGCGMTGLRLEGCQVGHAGPEALAPLVSNLRLRSLVLRGTAICELPVRKHQEPVRTNSREEQLALQGRMAEIREADVADIMAWECAEASEEALGVMRGVGRLPALERVDLGSTGLSAACAGAFAEGVAERAAGGGAAGQHLRVMLSQDRTVRSAGLVAIAAALTPAAPTPADGAGGPESSSDAGGAAASASSGAGAAAGSAAPGLSPEAAATWGLGVSLAMTTSFVSSEAVAAVAAAWEAQVDAALARPGLATGVLFRSVDVGATRSLGPDAVGALCRAAGRALGQAGLMGGVVSPADKRTPAELAAAVAPEVSRAMVRLHAVAAAHPEGLPPMRLDGTTASFTGPGLDLAGSGLDDDSTRALLDAVAAAIGHDEAAEPLEEYETKSSAEVAAAGGVADPAAVAARTTLIATKELAGGGRAISVAVSRPFLVIADNSAGVKTYARMRTLRHWLQILA